MKAKIFTFFIFLFLLVATAKALPSDWWGKVEIDGANADGAVVDAYVNENKVASATVGEIVSGYYLMHVEAGEEDKVTFKVNDVDVGDDLWTEGDSKKLDLDFTATSGSPPANLGGSPGGGGGGTAGCTPSWQCTTWTACSQAGTQTRTCTDKNNCGTTTGKPVEIQTCSYVPPKTTGVEEEAPTEEETTTEEGVHALTEGEGMPGTTGTAVTDTSGGFGGITGMFFQNITGSNKWVGIGVIILVLFVGYSFYFFVLKKK